MRIVPASRSPLPDSPDSRAGADADGRNGLGLIGASAARVAKRLGLPADSFTERVLGAITTTTDAGLAVARADVVLEAVVERLGAKQALFAALDALAPPTAVFATNTSGLRVADVAARVSPGRRRRFGGIHFFNPVPVMRLVEVPRTDEMDNETFDLLLDLARRLGKTPVRCKDTPGFIVNRLNVPYKREFRAGQGKNEDVDEEDGVGALTPVEVVRMLERGDATAEDIDTAMKLGAGYPMGPLELFDLTGIDTTHYLTLGWQEYAKRGLLPEELVRPTKMMADMVDKGEIGRKSGMGFYDVS